MIYFEIAIGVLVLIIGLAVWMDKRKEKKLIALANLGNTQAQYDLAIRYRYKKPGEAFQLFEKAAKSGYAQAQLALALQYKEGNGIEKNLAQTIYWLEKASEQGLADAQYELGYCCMMGQGIKEDDVKAFNWFKKAVDNGSTKAKTFKSLADVQYKLALAYKAGEEGKEKDPVKAMTYLTKAAENGHADAQYELGYCYMIGQGVKEDDVKAFSWFEKAVANGSAKAKTFKSLADVQYKMALAYKEGEEGKAKDPVKANAYLTKAAEQGHADAQYKIALNYLAGEGDKKDPVQAVIWLKKAAEQGHADAQYELGRCYMLGNGVAENKSQAISWFEKAVANGSGSAQSAQEIVGFKEIEQNSSIGSSTKHLVIEMQYELVKAGYKLSLHSTDRGEAEILVNGGFERNLYEEKGYIRIYSPKKTLLCGNTAQFNADYSSSMSIVDVFLGLEIYSFSRSQPGQYPMWLKICARVRKAYKCPVGEPGFLVNGGHWEFYSKYINSVFDSV